MKSFVLVMTAGFVLVGMVVSGDARPNQHQKHADENPTSAEQRQPEPTVPLGTYNSINAALHDTLTALHTEQEARAKENTPNYEPWYAPSVLVQIALFIVASFYTYFAWGQLGAIEKQSLLTEETLIRDKRAFVFADGLQFFYDPPDASGVYNFRLRPFYKNSGFTPTKELVSHVHCEIRNDELPRNYSFIYDETNEANIGQGMVGPQTGVYGGAAPVNPITPQDIIDVQNRRRFIYLWGRIEYFDVFRNTPRHTTHFCWLIFPMGDPYNFDPSAVGQPPVPGTMLFQYFQHREGNYAD